ncbi:MAG: hypothetical protein O7G84_03030 [Gammaproteobacteria bacterium]|nr:hypothetical protein [Gammaproteobacteria bacterium]
MDLRNVALAVWATAWIGAIGAYLLSAADGYVPWCIPHFEGCASISAAGRHGWGYFLFKATMLPSAVFGIIYWILCAHWLYRLAGQRTRCDTALSVLGIIGALALVLYGTFLGSEGDVYQLLRRYATVLYFGFTYLAQLLLSYRARSLDAAPGIVSAKLWLGLIMLTCGLVLGALINLVEDDDHLENVSEWIFATLLTLYPLLTWRLWRQTAFKISYSLPGEPRHR